ncbi:unnamed protein product [Citrullus colocynthis]|uniref:Secreted protein n=1 Tax=Citrullus colocynthis TaxID=252529 RepID=A0ABP0Y3F2_9ROSI
MNTKIGVCKSRLTLIKTSRTVFYNFFIFFAPPINALEDGWFVGAHHSVHERNDRGFQKSDSEFGIIPGSKSAAHRLRIFCPTFLPHENATELQTYGRVREIDVKWKITAWS